MEKIKNNYTNFILKIIAVGIVGLNYHLFKGGIISEVQAASHEVHKIAICTESGSRCVNVTKRGLWIVQD